MASWGHIKYIPEVLYIYNFQNPISDQKVQRAKVEEIDKKIRTRKRYEAMRTIIPTHKPSKKLFAK
jgi:hypothetical protein